MWRSAVLCSVVKCVRSAAVLCSVVQCSAVCHSVVQCGAMLIAITHVCFSNLSLVVDDLRCDVVERGCRVNREEVQTMALALAKISKHLATLKGSAHGHPQPHSNTRIGYYNC